MSAVGDQMRAAADALEREAMSPWTARLPDTATNASALLRQGAAAADKLVSLNLNLPF